MFRKVRRKILAAWWAIRNEDQLTMFAWELSQDSLERNSNGGITLAANRAYWYYSRYLHNLPIR
jgi:hypothetical protein